MVNNTVVAFAGSLTADGNGKITAWKDQAVIPAIPPIIQPNFKIVTAVHDRYQEAKSLGVEILYFVEPDCRIRVTATFLEPNGAASPVVWVGTLASGGQEALVMNGSAQSPYFAVVTVKRAAQKGGGEKE